MPEAAVVLERPRERPVIVAEDVPQEVGLQLMESEGAFKAVRTELTPTRSYPKPYGINFAHVAGYLGPMNSDEVAALDEESQAALANSPIGRSGLEQQYNDVLSGRPGIQQVSVSRSGRVTDTLRDEPAVAGENLVTSVDAKLQALVEQQLAAAIARGRDQGKPSDSGTIIVSDVNTGRILALASAPTYDPKIWVGESRSRVCVTHRPEEGQSAPQPSDTGHIRASVHLQGRVDDRCHQGGGTTRTAPTRAPRRTTLAVRHFGTTNHIPTGRSTWPGRLQSPATRSLQTRQRDVAQDGGLNPSGNPTEAMYNAARDYGLGKPDGIDIPGESSGRVVGREQKKADYLERKDDFCRRATEGYPK